MNRLKDENPLKEQIYKQVYDLIYHQLTYPFDKKDFSAIDVKVYDMLMVGIYNQVRNAVEFDIKHEISN